MRILIAGGTGFLGSSLARSLSGARHEVWILTRRTPQHANEIQWDGRSAGGWANRLAEIDAVVHVTGYGLEHWPWTAAQKRRFVESRVVPGALLASAIENSVRRPKVFIQTSGTNYYGLRGEGVADESSPPADDFLARLAVEWEAATRRIEQLGVRRVVARSAVVLAARGGLFPLMALPVRLMIGGPMGNGRQAMPWIHIDDEVAALQFLIENERAAGAFNLIAPQFAMSKMTPTSFASSNTMYGPFGTKLTLRSRSVRYSIRTLAPGASPAKPAPGTMRCRSPAIFSIVSPPPTLSGCGE